MAKAKKTKTTVFNLMDQEEAVSEMVTELQSKNPTGFKTLSEIQYEFIVLPNLALQWLVDCVGIPLRSITEVVGEEGIGKTVLMNYIMGHATESNHLCCYFNTDSKFPMREWILRNLHSDKKKAAKIEKLISFYAKVRQFKKFEADVVAWCEKTLEKFPIEVPRLVIADVFSRMQPPEEVLPEKAREYKTVDERTAQPGNAARWQAKWVREFGNLIDKYNITFIATGGQTENIGATNSFKYSNDNRPGGRALKQDAAIRIVMTRQQAYRMDKKDDSGTVGDEIKLFVKKNSYGTKDRTLIIKIRNKNFKDTETYRQPALELEEPFCNLLVDHGIFGASLSRKKYSAPEIGILGVEAKELNDFIHGNEDLRNYCGYKLGIAGYPEFKGDVGKLFEKAKKQVEYVAQQVDEDETPAVPLTPDAASVMSTPNPLETNE